MNDRSRADSWRGWRREELDAHVPASYMHAAGREKILGTECDIMCSTCIEGVQNEVAKYEVQVKPDEIWSMAN